MAGLGSVLPGIGAHNGKRSAGPSCHRWWATSSRKCTLTKRDDSTSAHFVCLQDRASAIHTDQAIRKAP